MTERLKISQYGGGDHTRITEEDFYEIRVELGEGEGRIYSVERLHPAALTGGPRVVLEAAARAYAKATEAAYAMQAAGGEVG